MMIMIVRLMSRRPSGNRRGGEDREKKVGGW
jgi:hypothetical protein